MFRFVAAMFTLTLSLGLATSSRAAYQLVWQDEFNGSAVDLSKWEPQIGTGCPNLCGWGNNELQYYRAENAVVSGGVLKITAKQESFGGQQYTSARLRTKFLGDWKRGRFEMRAKMPIGRGIWPAFWMLPTDEVYGTWAASGEIDILEYLGHQPNRVFGTLHYGGTFPANQLTSNAFTLGSGTFHDDYHIFALEWDECSMRWLIDGNVYATQRSWFSTGGPYPAPFDERFHLLLNMAVGGNLPGPPDGTTVFPQEYLIDWVRVYQEPGADLDDCITLFDDMEHANPFGNNWFSFGGTVGGGGISANLTDLPPIQGCQASLETGWGSGGTPGFFGGFGRGNPMNVSDCTHFTFWINPDAGQNYRIEINLRDDDNGDNSIPGVPTGADDEFQFNCFVGPTGPHVISGGGWQRVSIPLADFVDDNSFYFGGNGIFDPKPVSAGGNGQLILVVDAIYSLSGADVTFRTDRWQFTRQTSSMAGRVWNDVNADGTQGGGELGLSGVKLELFDLDLNAVVATKITPSSGDYAFSALLGGRFEVRVDPTTLSPTYVPTFDPDGVASLHKFSQDLNCDQSIANMNFGYRSSATGVSPLGGPSSTSLFQNVPNPFKPRTKIDFELTRPERAELVIYDIAGRRVRTLFQELMPAGRSSVEWDGRDHRGAELSAGVYFYQLRTEEETLIKKMVLLD